MYICLIYLFTYSFIYLYYIYMAMSQEPGTLPPAGFSGC